MESSRHRRFYRSTLSPWCTTWQKWQDRLFLATAELCVQRRTFKRTASRYPAKLRHLVFLDRRCDGHRFRDTCRSKTPQVMPQHEQTRFEGMAAGGHVGAVRLEPVALFQHGAQDPAQPDLPLRPVLARHGLAEDCGAPAKPLSIPLGLRICCRARRPKGRPASVFLPASCRLAAVLRVQHGHGGAHAAVVDGRAAVIKQGVDLGQARVEAFTLSVSSASSEASESSDINGARRVK